MHEGSWWAPGAGGLVVSVRAVPGARRSEVAGVVDGRLRVRVAAPASEGRANAELARFLAGCFGVRRRAVSVVRGQRSGDKHVVVAGVAEPPSELRALAGSG